MILPQSGTVDQLAASHSVLAGSQTNPFDVNTRKMATSDPSKTAPIMSISELDVVLGRASGTQGHKGNFRYRALCHTAANCYHAARGNANLKRAIVQKVIEDVGPGRFLKRQEDGTYQQVDGKERYTKVQTDLRTGRIGRMMNKNQGIPKEQVEAAVASLARSSALPIVHGTMPNLQLVPQSESSPNPGHSVVRTISNVGEPHMGDPYLGDPIASRHATGIASMRLEVEYLELAKEKEMLIMRNKILKLKQDLKGLREYNRQLESSHPMSEGEIKEPPVVTRVHKLN